MTTNPPTDVPAAFERLLAEIEQEIAVVNQAGGRAFETGDHPAAAEALARARRMTAIRDKVTAQHIEWEELLAPAAARVQTLAERRDSGRARRATWTPIQAYIRPILQALVDLDGAAPIDDVLVRVELLMKPNLRPADYERINAIPRPVRWRYTAQLARDSMVNDGLMQDNSRRGIWEITDTGRRYLEQDPT